MTLEQESLAAKVTASRVTERYRHGEPFASAVLECAREALGYYLGLPMLDEPKTVVRPNKATMHTWLCVIAEAAVGHALPVAGDLLGRAIGKMSSSGGTDPAITLIRSNGFSMFCKIARPLGSLMFPRWS